MSAVSFLCKRVWKISDAQTKEIPLKSDLKDRMLDFCDRECLLKPGSTLIVGLSGGADSICLFRILSDICPGLDISLAAVHVHHGIRRDEADRDESFSREVAENLGVPFVSVRVDAPGYAGKHGISLEEAARILRHRELERIRQDRGAYAIALAHHMGDQVETVLMNIFRGTSPVGLCGMEPQKDHIIRPLLFVDKKEILSYLSEYDYKYMEDSTNSDTDYTRNMIRHTLIPLIEKEYPGAGEHVASLARDMVSWRNYIHDSTDVLLYDRRHGAADDDRRPGADDDDGRPGAVGDDGRPGAADDGGQPADPVDEAQPGVTADDGQPADPSDNGGCDEKAVILSDQASLPVRLYLGQPAAIQGELIRRALDAVMPGMKDIGRVHYDMIHRLFMANVTGKSVDLPKKLTVIRDYDKVIFRAGPDPEYVIPDPVELAIPGETEIIIRGEKIVISSEIIDIHTYNKKKHEFFQEKDYTKCLDYGKIEKCLMLRTPTASDYILLKGGRKKLLSRVYIDDKIPRDDRKWQTVIADGSHVVWAFPDRLSSRCYVTDSTETVLKITRSQTEHGGYDERDYS